MQIRIERLVSSNHLSADAYQPEESKFVWPDVLHRLGDTVQRQRQPIVLPVVVGREVTVDTAVTAATEVIARPRPPLHRVAPGGAAQSRAGPRQDPACGTRPKRYGR